MAAPASKDCEASMQTAYDAPVPATLLFPVGWKTNALEWMIIRVALLSIAFWLGGCAVGL